MVVTGDYSAVLNAYVEILKASAGSRLIGLLPHRRPHASQVFEALVADKGLSKEQATLLNELYVLEGRLEHASPDVDAEEVRVAVERLRAALPELVKSAQVAGSSRHRASVGVMSPALIRPAIPSDTFESMRVEFHGSDAFGARRQRRRVGAGARLLTVAQADALRREIGVTAGVGMRR
jgi:hypothetical protein